MKEAPSTGEILKTLREHLEGIGMVKRRVGFFELALAPDFTGTVGLGTTAGGYPKGVRGVWPVVGIRHGPTEALLARFYTNWRSAPIIARPLGYLLPSNTWTEFGLSVGAEYETTRIRLASAVQEWGFPFMRAHVTIDSILETLVAKPGVTDLRPFLLLQLGREAEALAVLDELVESLPDRPSPYRDQVLRLAKDFREYVAS